MYSNDSAIFTDAGDNSLGDFATTRFLKRKPHAAGFTNAAGVPSGAAINTFVARLKSRSFKAKLQNKATPKSHPLFRRSHIRDDDEDQPEVLNIVAKVEPGSRVDAIASQLHAYRPPTVRRFPAHRPPFRRSHVPKQLQEQEQEQEQEIKAPPPRKKPLARRLSGHRPPFRRSHAPKIQGEFPFAEITSGEFVNLFRRRGSAVG